MREAGAPSGRSLWIADIASGPNFAEREIVIDIEDAQFGSLPIHDILQTRGTDAAILQGASA
jgi:hypothetical protein